MTIFSRRRVLANGLLGVGSIALAGCDRLTGSGAVNEILGSAEGLTQSLQRLALGRSLARECTEADLSPVFRVNGTSQPDSAEYAELQTSGIADWRMKIDCLGERTRSLSPAD